MKYSFLPTWMLICCIGSGLGCSSMNDHVVVVDRDAGQFSIPEVETFFLSNGIKVFYKEDTELPTFSATLYVPRGAKTETRLDSAQYAALDDMLRSGGTTTTSPDALDAQLESLSASIKVHVDNEYSLVGLSGLKDDAETLAALSHDIIETPGFDKSRLALWKSQSIDSIKKRGDSIDAVASTAFLQLFYQGSELGAPLTIPDVERVTVENLQMLNRKIFGNEKAVIVLTGDIPLEKAKEILEKNFGDLPATIDLPAMSRSTVPTIHQKPGLYFIEKPFPQSSVFIGQLGPRRFVEDYPAIEVFNGVFGAEGQFSSMLTQAIRTQRGLSYSVGGGIFRDEPVGRNFIGFQTKSDSVAEGILVAFDTLSLIQQGKFSDDHVADVKTSTRNSFVFRYDSIAAIAQRKAVKELLNYPSSYDETFLAKIGEVTPKQVTDVANKYWRNNELIILVVGDGKAYDALKRDPRLKKYKIKKLNFTQELQFP